MSKNNDTLEPEIDTEWMKFMSRITRHQNCDTVDAGNDSCDDDDSEEDRRRDNAAIGAATTTMMPELRCHS